MNIKNARENRENSEVLLGPKGKDFPEESTVNSVKAYKETKENEDRKRFWIFFFYDYPEGSWNITKAAEAEPKGIRIK